VLLPRLQREHRVARLAYPASVASLAAARRSSADFKDGGNAFPRRSARRRIPRHAFGLKQYFGSGHSSSTCDNEHTRTSLGHAEPLSVQHAPDAPAQRADADASRAPPFFRNGGPEAGEALQANGEVGASGVALVLLEKA
jgi:hypothetical protein